MTATINAVPKPSKSNESPIILSVINNVNVFMTNREKIPSVRIVIGNVKIIKIGRTRIFRMDKIKLAMIAEPKLETSNPSKYLPSQQIKGH